MTHKNLYAVLGLDKGASDDDIKKQYYALAKKYHPDKNQDANAEEKFKEIGKAYEALKDPEARRDYELQRRAEEMDARATAMAKNPTKFTFSGGRFKGNAFGFSSDDLHDIFRSTFRQRNKENRKPDGRPEWDENWSESSAGGPSSFSFTFSNGFSEQPRPPPSKMGNIDDMFDDFFRDPFFMDSSPFGDYDPTCGGNYRQEEPVRPQSSSRTQTRPEPEDNPRVARAKEEALRKAARDDELKRTREEAQRNAAREEAKRKAEEEKMYDWQNGLFSRANRGEGETGPNSSVGGATSRFPSPVAGSRQDYTFSVYDNDPTSWSRSKPYVPFTSYVPSTPYVPSSGSSTRFKPFIPTPTSYTPTSRENSFTGKHRKSVYDNNNNNIADYDEGYQYDDKSQVPFANGPSYASRPLSPHPETSSPKREAFSPKRETFSPKRDTFSPKRDTFSPKRDTFSPKRDTFSPKRDTFSPKRDTFSPKRETFSPKRETFSPNQETFSTKRETFSPNRETFSPKRETFSPKRDTFSPIRETFSPNRETFSPKRDTFSPSREPLSSNNNIRSDPVSPTKKYYQRPNVHSTGPGSSHPYYFDDESPAGTKLICNYCQNKFHPAALTAHENVCRSEYYGKQEREAASPSPPPPPEEPIYTPRAQTRRPPPRSQSFNARSSGTNSGSFKDDLLRNAYRAAAYETLASQPVREEPIALNMQVCEYCNVAFSDTVAKYHIPFCGRKHGKTTASAATPSSASASDTRHPEYATGEPSSTYRSTYRAPPSGPRPTPRATAAAAAASAAGASAYDRINSPSFTNLGANIGRPRSTATTHDYTAGGPAPASASADDPYTYSTPLSNRVGRTSSSTTRIRYVPASGVRTRPAPSVRIFVGGGGGTTHFTFRVGRAATGGTI